MLTENEISEILDRCVLETKNITEMSYLEYDEGSFVDGELLERSYDHVTYTLFCGDKQDRYKHRFDMKESEGFRNFFNRILPDLKNVMFKNKV